MPAGPIYSVADMVADPHYQARGMFEQVVTNGRPLKVRPRRPGRRRVASRHSRASCPFLRSLTRAQVPAIVPKLSETPGATEWAGPRLGEHTASTLQRVLGLDAAAIQRLVATKAIYDAAS